MLTFLLCAVVAAVFGISGFFLYPVLRRRKLAQSDLRPFCLHGPTKGVFTVTVFGRALQLSSSPYCPACTEEYFNLYCTHCALCPEPILPGMPVVVAGSNERPKAKYVHGSCDDNDVASCGIWGEGELVPPKIGRNQVGVKQEDG
jgi:hypothetical protein